MRDDTSRFGDEIEGRLPADADEGPERREDRIAFERELRKWAGMLHLRNMKFLIMSVPVINAAAVASRYTGMKEQIFKEMEFNTIYKFDFDGIKIEDVKLG